MADRFSLYKLILFLFFAPVFADSHHPQEFLKAISGSKNEGEQIYNHFCVNCHAQKPVIPLGAPRIGIESDWLLRVKQGINVLFKHTNEGLNAMPSRGGCFECTDDQLLLSILEMVPEKDKKVLLNELSGFKKYKK
jgi:cytochrome c5